jgi:uncharacterized protein YcfJ
LQSNDPDEKRRSDRAEEKDQAMSRTAIAVAVLGAFAGSVGAAPDFTDSARVISSTPLVERVYETRQECEPLAAVPPPVRERSIVGPLVGGVAGALLGSQVGKGSGRNAATAVGAVVGTIVGDRVANPGSERPVTGAVIGGAAGGLAGAQIGKGNGKTAATGAGAIAGSMIGDRVQNSPQAQSVASAPPERCRTVESPRDVTRGYTVVYRYNGHDVTTTLPYDPGSTVRVGIGILQDGAPATGSGAAAPSERLVDRPLAPSHSMSVRSTGGYTYRY